MAIRGQETTDPGQETAQKQPVLAIGPSLGGLGGLSSVSDLFPIPASSGPSQQSGSDPKVITRSDQARAKEPYSPGFEAFWVITWKEGGKGAAAKAWAKAGGPTAQECKPAIDAYLAAKRASGQAIAHVSSWLNAGGHLQTEWVLSPLTTKNVDFRPQWVRDRDDRAAAEKRASARYHEQQSQKPQACGYHYHRGQDPRYVLEECPKRCPMHGKDAEGHEIAV